MAGNLHVEVVTPESTLWSGEASALVTRSSEGDLTVMAEHTPIVGDVVPGVVRVQSTDGERAFIVHGGFFQVSHEGEGVTLATVLAGTAERVEDVDVARASAAKEAAEAVLAQRGDDADDPELDSVRSSLARAQLRLSVKG